ncbi:hypothetical protein A2276_08530 [candidate division WOR-1 bacterium RIFOXYA12_FULL_43_27]|uniref:Uncharacterized protein n=1 Tax=candidate division WOR-1 bacterium RIFOXYC2_FULL_46_14 TaxID=1802587 RepID=A0A1F4U684_UNCSA|nr:MAG: hypothetical protein A2276_08530 [candidate division WOR-1 bacterium RIFOXYA12_FULL_43_27]OGC20637.1 MAG: hypothetical protein A2292_06355 [candidate division WOR-1 bacterium RIFOXYB2_FULL_46_45]OGC31626.1 MAG: hypothetical protein A2232_05095 [candidate division WOR-1 bacterium RIFOXYA2_FULL_46_56]OGC40478.1 MAG: hypothetical protein A2438_04385 [candidate division WOR-1 bacterium RIFOXYC2_FULL_46_14]
MRILLTISALLAALAVFAAAAPFYESADFSINFSPDYPLIIGKETQIKVVSPITARRVTAVFDNEDKVRLNFENGSWLGKYLIPADFESGWHPLNIYFVKKAEAEPNLFQKFFFFIRLRSPEPKYKDTLIKRSMNIRIFKQEELDANPLLLSSSYPSNEAEVVLHIERATLEGYQEIGGEPEGATLDELLGKPVSKEAFPLRIKGSRIFTFNQKTVEGTKESYLPGAGREESLRINVSGKMDGTEIDANFFSTSSLSTTQTSTREEKVSILLRRGSLEAYMGDFTADLNDTEFTPLTQLISGIRIQGENKYGGFKAIVSTPKGSAKITRLYGNGTQGPYYLTPAPVEVDSERVYLNDLLQKRGDEYTIDYNAGTITFRKKTLISTDIIETYYNYRETIYQHGLYAFRGYVKPSDRLRIGASYINDSDSLQNAQSIQSQTGANPKSHQVFGLDSTVKLWDTLSIDSEFAISDKNHNLLGVGTRETGTAGKIAGTGYWGPFMLKGNYKKINPGFVTAAVALPKTNLLDYGGTIGFTPFNFFSAQGDYNYNRYTEAGINYEISGKALRSKLSLSPFPRLDYTLSEDENSNDPVTGSTIRRIINRNRLLANYDNIGIFNFSAKGEKERRLYRSPSEEVITYDTASAGISTNSNLKIFSGSANAEYKRTTDTLNPVFSTKTYDLKLSASPSESYLLSTNVHYVDDGKDGKSNVTDLSYKIYPVQMLGSDGNYSISSVKESFGSSEARVSKQSGSFKLDFRPIKPLRLRYYFKPNFTLFDATGAKIYNNENQQAEATWAVLNDAVLGYSYKTIDNFSIDKSSYPLLDRKSSASFTTSNLYTLKAAPLSFLSTEFNVVSDNSIGDTLISTTGASAVYRRDNARVLEYNAAIRTSLTQVIAVDTKYSHKTTLKGSGESFSDSTYTIDQTGSIKGTLNPNPDWSFSASGAATFSQDLLNKTKTYILSPGLGFIYRWGTVFRIDGDYVYSRSYSALRNSTHKFSLKAKYSLSQYVNVSFTYEHERSGNPYYRTTDLAGIVEINI